VQRFTPLLVDAPRPCRHAVGDRWFVDETYVKVVVTALRAHREPTEVVTDRAWTLRAVVDDLIPAAFHNTAQYANNRIEADHSRLKARLRPMRGLKRDHTARVIVRGHAFMQNLRRGHYELGVKPARTGASRWRSPNSPEPSDRTCHAGGHPRVPPAQRNSVLCVPKTRPGMLSRCFARRDRIRGGLTGRDRIGRECRPSC
jgi:DDE domain